MEAWSEYASRYKKLDHGVIITDAAGGIRFVNENQPLVRMGGKKLLELQGKPIEEVFPDLLKVKGLRKRFERLRKKGTSFSASFSYRSPYVGGGKPNDFLVIGHPLPEGKGMVFHTLLQSDVSEKGPGRMPPRVVRGLIALMSASHRHDPQLASHGELVSNFAAALAEHMGLDEPTVSRIRWAGFLHDVGKLAVPVEVLEKPGKLSAAEWKRIAEHPRVGAELVRDLLKGYDPRIARIIESYHLPFKGKSAYPRPFWRRGKLIPLEARLLGLADAYVSIRSPRAYSEEKSHAKTMEILEAEVKRGKYDPKIFGAMKTLPQSAWEDFEDYFAGAVKHHAKA